MGTVKGGKIAAADVTDLVRSVTFVVGADDSKNTDDVDYLCDGTADEVEINQAITDLPGKGGTIVLLEGTYSIGANITINTSDVNLVGQGSNTEITQPNSTNVDLIVVSSADCKILNLYLDGNKGGNTSGSGIRIAAGGHRLTVQNCKIQLCREYGVEMTSTASETRIVGNFFDRNENQQIGDTGTNQLNRCIIFGNRIDGGTTGITGKFFFSTIANNVLLNATGTSLHLHDGASRTTIGGNHIRGSKAIFLEGASSVVGNISITGNTCQPTDTPSLDLDKCDNSAFTGNQFSTRVDLTSNSGKNMFAGNYFTAGVNIAAGNNNNAFTGNFGTITDNGTGNILVGNSD